MPPRAFLAAHRDPSMPAAAIGYPAVPDRLGALWADMAAHQSRIEEVLFEDKSKTSNPVRAQIITEVNSMMMICAEFQAAAAGREGALQELRHQLAEARREAAGLRVCVAMGAAASGPPRSYADVVAGGRGADVAGPASGAPPGFRASPRGFGGAGGATGPANDAGPPGHLAFLTPIGESRDPSGDVLAVLKTNVDPTEAGIGEVDLRSTRLGVTVVAKDRDTIMNLKQAIDACPVTRSSMTVRVPEKRRPHVRLVGVDPEVSAANLISAINGRNPSLELDTATAKVKSTFKERGGNNSHILELSPPDFKKVMTRGKVCVGWTSARVVEDIHVPLCTQCATYGHTRRLSPVRSDPARSVCTKCAEHHLAQECTVRFGDAAVCCAPCRGAGLEASGQPAGYHACPVLLQRVARLRARTDYGN
ncbi:hypothetical protein HPB49_014036 [Dermacentor silvarum]|uniref:Uncharacterized protein n=1 Tax=Dermacentor silvarum TaxID=543639 RepID=A0ACB8C4C1_DERSI|nr:hypothetical protein HPB49_014036 [Dermacentor silvarum]